MATALACLTASFVDALLPGHPPVELLHGEGLPAPFPFDEGGDLGRELGGQVRRFVAGQPLPERLERGADGLSRPLVAIHFREVLYLGDELLAVHVASLLSPP